MRIVAPYLRAPYRLNQLWGTKLVPHTPAKSVNLIYLTLFNYFVNCAKQNTNENKYSEYSQLH